MKLYITFFHVTNEKCVCFNGIEVVCSACGVIWLESYYLHLVASGSMGVLLKSVREKLNIFRYIFLFNENGSDCPRG